MTMKVSHILSSKTGDLVTITPEQTIKTAVKQLVERNIGALLVVDDNGNLVGILSERDIIRWSSQTDDVLKMSVAEVMTRNVVTGLPQDDLMSVANTMTERRFRHLPIMDGGKLIGIISIGDVLKAQRDKYRGEIDTLETQLMADK
ncbi:MAG: CBS domain-containing protein [Candidatus Promineifilaceae bacterium]